MSSNNLKQEYIYIITNETNAKDNKYKIGYHSGTIAGLEKRYKTYLQTPIIMFLHHGTKHDEGVILKLLDKFRVDNSEWVQLDVNKLLQVTLKHFLNSAEITDLTNRLPSLTVQPKPNLVPVTVNVPRTPQSLFSQNIIDKFNRTRTTSGAKSSDEMTKVDLVNLGNSIGAKVSLDMTTRDLKVIIQKTMFAIDRSISDRLVIDVGTPVKDRSSVNLTNIITPNKFFLSLK
jgi:hypothetical protein